MQENSEPKAALPDSNALASELASALGREQGPNLLKVARASMVLSASKPGETTSEFKIAGLAVIAGLSLVFLGVWKDDASLRSEGVNLVTIASAGYSVSRGMGKLGAGIGSKTETKA